MAEQEKSEADGPRRSEDERARRLADALKANLKRRKAQARARKAGGAQGNHAQGADSEQS